jgi:peptidoglycan/LPS O-acetylase OafA/YrhL
MLGNLYNRLRRITTNQLYFPEIDGIRFLAIMLVVLFHSHGYFINKSPVSFADNPDNYNLLNLFLYNGDRGVELFFVLSGFILCLPFAHYYINNGKKVSLKKYYLRRVTRLEPPYFIAMTGIFLLLLATKVHPVSTLLPSWLASLVYSHSVIYHHAPLITVVAWSLEIEIQFYLLAPLLFSLLAINKIARRVILLSTAAGLVCLQHFYPPPFSSIYGFAQFFLIGICLADFYVSNTAAKVFNKPWMLAVSLACFIALIYLPVKNRIHDNTLLLSRLLLPFTIGLFYYTIFKNDRLKKLFSYKFIPIIGGMCYTIYLLHYTIIAIVGRYTIGLHMGSYYLPNLCLQIILFCIPILLVSSVFYYYIERPFMSSKWLNMLMKKDKKSEETNTVT